MSASIKRMAATFGYQERKLAGRGRYIRNDWYSNPKEGQEALFSNGIIYRLKYDEPSSEWYSADLAFLDRKKPLTFFRYICTAIGEDIYRNLDQFRQTAMDVGMRSCDALSDIPELVQIIIDYYHDLVVIER